MHSSLIAWIMRAIPFGTIIMYGALGETVTEKSGNLNLGVPGIMYLGGFAGFASAWAYENTAANPNGFVSILIAMSCAILASMAGGLIYAFLTISLRANQNVTGLALTTFGMGVANFFGVFILNGASYSAAPIANKAFSAKLPVLSGLGALGQTVFSYGFLAYAAIALAVVLHWFLTRTRAGLNLRAVGETPPRRMRRASMSRFTSIWLPASAQASAASAACTMCWTTIRASGPPPARSRRWAGWPWHSSSLRHGNPSMPSGAPTCSVCSTGCTSSCPACSASRWPAI